MLIVFPERLTDVLSRVRFDLRAALSARNRLALAHAVRACLRCSNGRACRRWIASHGEGEANRPPAFCRLADYIGAHEPPRRGATSPRPFGKRRAISNAKRVRAR